MGQCHVPTNKQNHVLSLPSICVDWSGVFVCFIASQSHITDKLLSSQFTYPGHNPRVFLSFCLLRAQSFISPFSLPAEDWKAVNVEHQKSTRYVIKNQTTGDRLKIRVVAVNAGGRSPPVALPEAVLVKEVAGK